MTPAKILCETYGKEELTEDDIDEVDKLFFDAKASAKLLQEQSNK